MAATIADAECEKDDLEQFAEERLPGTESASACDQMQLGDHVGQGPAEEEKQSHDDQDGPSGAQTLGADEDPFSPR